MQPDSIIVRDRKFDELCSKVHFCTRCVRMEESARVLSRAAGSLTASVMFIGEAPGRLGADASEIPFHGDQAGQNFEDLLAFAGFNRADVFITNAVLCNPKSPKNTNATPTSAEVDNCSPYLREQLALVEPRIVVPLGSVALEALRRIESHDLTLAGDVRTAHKWFGRLLVPLYHPGARAVIHRSRANQRSDIQFVAELHRRLGVSRRLPNGLTPRDVTALAFEVIRRRSGMSYFALHKLVYLCEVEAVRSLGHRLTTAFFLRQKDGPYCTDLHLTRLRRALPMLRVTGGPKDLRLSLSADSAPVDLFEMASEASEVVDRVTNSAAGMSDSQLKTRVYLSSPMRRLLRIERSRLVNLYNAPIDFEEASVASGAPSESAPDHAPAR
jgi:uracil-DNA glycosylase family 4